jgi:DNA-binding CsgD family transcriptional regulator
LWLLAFFLYSEKEEVSRGGPWGSNAHRRVTSATDRFSTASPVLAFRKRWQVPLLFLQLGHSKVFIPPCAQAKLWRITCFWHYVLSSSQAESNKQGSAASRKEAAMLDLSDIKITQRDEQVLHLLVEGCSNKEIAKQLNISPRTVKQHLRTLFLRAGITDGRKRVKLATAVFQREQRESHATL